MAETRLERSPWRFVWECELCEHVATRPVPRTLVGTLVEMFDREGGSKVSRREVREFEAMDLEIFEELIREEIYLEA
jgi:hypothetical protein